MNQSVLEEHPFHHLARIARESLLVGEAFGLHLERVVAVVGQGGGVQGEDAVAFRGLDDGDVGVEHDTLAAYDDVFAGEGGRFDGFREGDGQLLDGSLGYLVLGYGLDVRHLEQYVGYGFEGNHVAYGGGSFGEEYDVELVIAKRFVAVQHRVLRLPAAVLVDLASGAVLHAEDVGLAGCRVGDGGIVPAALRCLDIEAELRAAERRQGDVAEYAHLRIAAIHEVDVVGLVVGIGLVVDEPGVECGVAHGHVDAVDQLVDGHFVKQREIGVAVAGDVGGLDAVLLEVAEE